MKPLSTKYLFFALILGASALKAQSPCGNLDFEDANYTGWILKRGMNFNSATAPTSVALTTSQSTTGINTPTVTHCIVSGTSTAEPNVIVPLIAQYGGSQITRINHIGTGSEAGILERRTTVNPAQPYLNFSYFVVFENAGHTAADQPYFRFNVLDANNTAIPSASLEIVAGTSTVNPGFVQSGNFFYKTWTPVSVDLSAYAGQTVTIQFVAADCAQSGHGGYAYVDMSCNATTSSVPVVWPGDANYDLTVNYLDLFYVGAGYGQTGTSRSSAGNTWAAATSADWGTSSMYLVDSKHADCNGDGTVDAADTTAISLNYGLSHPFRSLGHFLVAQNTDAQKPLQVTASQSTVTAGQNFRLDFQLGASGNTVDSVYAIGFTLNYPAHLFEPAATNMSHTASAAGSNLLSLMKPAAQSIDMAVTRRDHQNALAVAGNVFSLNLKAKASLPADTSVQFTLTNIKAVTKSGYVLQLAPAPATVQFLKPGSATGIASLQSGQEVSLFPNPAHDKLTVSITSGKIRSCKLYSVTGQELLSQQAEEATSLELNVSALPQGVYVMKLGATDGSSIEKRFVKE